MANFVLPKDGGLDLKKVPSDILHAYDRVFTSVLDDESEASKQIADRIVSAIVESAAKNPGGLFRLGLTTGKTPASLYKELRRRYSAGDVSFKGVEIFSIDEYYPTSTDAMQSRNARLHSELLDHIDLLPCNVHIPDGTVPAEKMDEYCAGFEKMSRELDLLVIGFGEQGQLGFNEAGAAEHSRTRTVMLSYESRKRQARNFNGEMAITPKMAITMGLSTILSARKVYLMAWGESKASIVHKIVEEEFDPMCPASYFQHHPNVHMFVDRTAAEGLTREVAPWLLGPCEWTPKFRRKAVVWLCQKLGKPILKLTQDDYMRNSLAELVDNYGPYSKINIEVFNDLQHTITGWPGGKPDADDSTRPVASSPFPKKVAIFSPHPDDDVISMGGTFIRLVHQGHDVHVAYETSGDLAVHDDVVVQHFDAAAQLGFGDRVKEVREIIAGKKPGEPEPKELLAIKAAIRRSEARGADRSFGLDESHVHFLNLPFYESGGVTKLPRTQADIDIIKAFLQEVQPDQVYMAGDLADPHGTHRVCTEAAMEAMWQLRSEGVEWVDRCTIWLYRGAWMEWDLGTVDMAVPISPEEVIEKRHAIYHHLSQKDIVPFPGDDPREFWQRAEDRTQNTARLYDELGMAEYQAIEVFVKVKI